MSYIGFFVKKMSDSLIPSFLVSNVSESLRSLTKNEQMSKSLVFLRESLIRSFFRKIERFAQKTDQRIPSPGKTRIFLNRNRKSCPELNVQPVIVTN